MNEETTSKQLEDAIALVENKLFTEIIDRKIEQCFNEWLNHISEGEKLEEHFKQLALAYKDVKQTVMQHAQNVIAAHAEEMGEVDGGIIQ